MFSERFRDLSKALQSCIYTTQEHAVNEQEALKWAFRLLSETLLQKGIVYVIGNGGSAGIASHFSNDLMKALQIPSQTLFDSNLMTCLSNDYGYDQVFSYPLEKLLKPSDLLVAISSSGKSANIVKAAETALAKKAKLMTLSGFSEENPLRKLGQLNFWIDRPDYGLVETAHFFLLHTIVDVWNAQKSLEKSHAQFIGSTPSKN